MDWKTKEGLREAVSKAIVECESCCLDDEKDAATVRDTVIMYVESWLEKPNTLSIAKTPEERMGQRVWSTLVSICGAYSDMDGIDEWRFVTWFVDRSYKNGCEWRFGGKLGMGGKFWINSGRWYVNCYREDETPERVRIMQDANATLGILKEEWNNAA